MQSGFLGPGNPTCGSVQGQLFPQAAAFQRAEGLPGPHRGPEPQGLQCGTAEPGFWGGVAREVLGYPRSAVVRCWRRGAVRMRGRVGVAGLWDFKGSPWWGCGVSGLEPAPPAPLPAGGIFSPGFAAPASPGDGAGEGFVEQLRSRGKLGRSLLPALRGDRDRDGVRRPKLDAGGTQRLRAGSPLSSWQGSVLLWELQLWDRLAEFGG